ncbi:MAG: hypothetical protein FH749_03400 [Firmicutes bacterium]|nr:hypothetical protein [Bacillota bacterium]
MELAFQIAAIGVGVVFMTLLMLNCALWVLKRLATDPEKKNEPLTASEASVEADSIPPEHVAIIAGAIAAQNPGYRIRAIKVAPNSNWQQSSLTDFRR